MAPIVIKIVRVSPLTDSSHDSDDSLFTLPLTFFDLRFIKSHPNKRVIFYKFTELTRELFLSEILPKLELSLSIVLRHYFPLSGYLKWHPQDPKPFIVVSQQDSVSLTVMETDLDFSLVSSNGIRPAIELHHLVPELQISHDSVSLLSLQITLFPNQGFSIGTTSHHAIIDAQTSTLFTKSWSLICKSLTKGIFPLLPKNLSPCFDRTVINLPPNLESKMIQFSNLTHLTPLIQLRSDSVRVTLELTRKNIEKLRARVKNESTRSLDLHLSTFVISYGYSWTCLVKARGGDPNRRVRFMYTVDLRNRLNPKVPETYVGNCVLPIGWFESSAKQFMEENGFVKAVEILSDSIKGLRSESIETLFERFVEGTKKGEEDEQSGKVAGSTRLGVYGADYGWGKPGKIVFLSADYDEGLSMWEKDESGGVEIGVFEKNRDGEFCFFLQRLRASPMVHSIFRTSKID